MGDIKSNGLIIDIVIYRKVIHVTMPVKLCILSINGLIFSTPITQSKKKHGPY